MSNNNTIDTIFAQAKALEEQLNLFYKKHVP